jgi:hypothetical protein
MLGAYFLVDLDSGAIVRDHVDLETLARKVGALKPWEIIRAQ